MSRTLYIIDGHAQIFRAYYAPFRALTAPSGEPTRATYVFCSMLLNLLKTRQPDYLLIVLDGDESKLTRKQLYPEYKAHRDPPPEDFHPQEERIISILQAIDMPILRHEGYEADDIIATLVRQADPDLEVYLVSRDKDLEQLLSDRVSMYDPMKEEVIAAADLPKRKGWTVAQAVDAQILTGDSVDNVPGVAGIGPKTAAKLLQQYGSFEEIVAHADELRPKQREKLLAFVPMADTVRQLVTLIDNVPITYDLSNAEPARLKWAAAAEIFGELGFRKLIDQLPVDSSTAAEMRDKAADASEEAAGNPDEAAARLRTPDGTTFTLVNTPEALQELAATLASQREFALDTETTSTRAMDAELVGISLSCEVGRGWYVPVMSQYGRPLPLELIRAHLGPLLANPDIQKIGHHLKYDLIILRNAGLPVAGQLFDTMIAAFAAEPGRDSFSLNRMAADLLGHEMIPITDLIGKGRQQLRMDQVPLEHIAEYAAEDADYTWRLKLLLEPQLATQGVDRLFYDVEMPLVEVLLEMEFEGISIDVPLLEQMGAALAERCAALADEIRTLAGTDFNPDSPKQLGEVLFDKLGFRVVRKTRTARSTDAETLAVLQRETGHALPARLLEYRELQKLRSTYIDALPRVRSPRTGRVHTSYHQTGAITGRLSSSEPNLQNIPVRTELGREIRKAFVPRSSDERLIVADYSQVELRVLAHLSQDAQLIAAFAADRDIHAYVAAQVNHVELTDVTPEMRARAKAINFGIIYGQSAFGLAQATGMSRQEAQAFIDEYFARYPSVRAFIDGRIADARRDGFVRTILGRRRPIRDINSRNMNARAAAERLAVNTVVQGSAAELIKVAMVNLHRRIAAERLPLRMLLQVHDELVCEAPADHAEELAVVVSETMSAAMDLRVPLKADAAVGANWLEAK